VTTMSGGPRKSPVFSLLSGVCFLVAAALFAPEAAKEANAILYQKFSVFDAPHLIVLICFVFTGVLGLWRFRGLRREAAKATDRITPADAPMANVRQNIDDLDDQLVSLLAQRQRQIEAAAEVKRNNAIPARVPERVDEVLHRVAARAEKENLDSGLAKSLWTTIIEWSIAYEARLMKSSGEERDSA
jgi:isochorismate pyruvate lyase